MPTIDNAVNNMEATQRIETQMAGKMSRSKLRAELEKAFVLEFDSKIGRKCNLGNVVVGIMNKDYSRGSQFDQAFVCEGYRTLESLGENERILHAVVSKSGSVTYDSLKCDLAETFSLELLDPIECGQRVRKQIEEMISTMASKESNGSKQSIWGVSLFASSHRNGQSLLVFRLHCEDLAPDSPRDDSKAFFLVIPTSRRMKVDAFAVADHLVSKEGYPKSNVFYLGYSGERRHIIENAN